MDLDRAPIGHSPSGCEPPYFIRRFFEYLGSPDYQQSNFVYTEPIDLRVVMIGKASVGKSLLRSKFLSTNEKLVPTIGSIYGRKVVRSPQREFSISIFDIGSAYTESLLPFYCCGGVTCVFIVIDDSDVKGLDRQVKFVRSWTTAPIHVIRTRAEDICPDDTDFQRIRSYAETNGLWLRTIHSMHISCINDAFLDVVKAVAA